MNLQKTIFFATIIGLFVVGTLVHARTGVATINYGVLAAAGVTLAIYSFLYGDNPFFKAMEHLYVGVGLGYQVVSIAWIEYIKPEAYKQLIRYAIRDDVPGRPEWALLPAVILSMLLLLRFFPKLGWMSRLPVAFIVGFTAATQIPNVVAANVLEQVHGTIKPLWLADGFLPLFGNVITLVGVITVLFYFFFSVEHRGAMGVGSRIGVWFLMVAFGASFGYTVMGRMALLVGRLNFLLGDWLRIPLT